MVFGKQPTVSHAPKVFSRENKNRPREMSSKKPVPMLRIDVPAKKNEIRDPRYKVYCFVVYLFFYWR